MARKKRGNGEGSVFQRASGKWIARISRPQRIERTAKSKQHALAILQKLQNENPTWGDAPERLSVADYLDRWLMSVSTSRAATTADSYRRAVVNHISPHFGGVQLDRMTPMHVRRWLDVLTTPSATTRYVFKVLRVAIAEAVQLGLIGRNPCDNVKPPRHRRKDIQPFTAAESRKIIDATESHRLAGVFHIALKCGLRQEELFGLRWEDVRDGEIVIRRVVTEVSGRAHHGPPKTAAGNRTVPIDTTTGEAIARRRAAAMKEGNAGSPLVFPSRGGGVMRRSNFGNRHWKPLLERLRIKHRGFHHCRHTAATLMLSEGVPVVTVAGILGHANSSVTAGIYAHYIPSAGKMAVELLAGRLAGDARSG